MRYVCVAIGHFLIHAFCLNLFSARAEDFTASSMANWHQRRGHLANGTAPSGDPPTTWDEAPRRRAGRFRRQGTVLDADHRGEQVVPAHGDQKPIAPWNCPPRREPSRYTLGRRRAGTASARAPQQRLSVRSVMCLDRTTGNVLWQDTWLTRKCPRRASPRSRMRRRRPRPTASIIVRSFALARHFLLRPQTGQQTCGSRTWGDMEINRSASAKEPRR